MKILAVSPFQEGLKINIEMLNRLEKEMKSIETSIETLVALDEAFKGEGGSAIRSFYNEVHLPFIRLFHMMQSDYLNVLERMVAALNQLEPNPSGFIRESFLEGEVEQGLTEIARITASLTDEANQIMNKVADIVALPNLDDSGVQDGVYNAKRKRDNTIKELHQFDSEQTAALTAIQDHMEVMERWITDASGLFTDNRTDIQFDTGQWAQLLAKNILQTDPNYQANFTAGKITNPDLKEELEQHMEAIVEAQNAIKQPVMEEETFNVSKAALKGGVGLASAYQAQPTLNQDLQAQGKPMSNPAGKSKNFIPPQAEKLVKGAANFLILDDINTILDKDASLLDKGLAVVSVTPIGKGIKAARLGFKLIKKAFGGKVKKVGKADEIGIYGIVERNVGKGNPGRTGKQSRLKEIADDNKVSTALRGEIKRDINEIKLGKRKNIRVPQGYHLAHRRGYEARKGYGYKYSDLQTIKSHKTQHKHDGYGRKIK
ncbi:T7SS effector LXG polymorphic toxin [Sporosarcina sp. Te-1]|uniref:T7SS effector LXG polymorphic toxin n=1 Tax=Sporosarcina sp. Te-1 TaxID=2818390 RepID=UPI001A9D648D|nr:T7SS effector LXG polymorphic toxin [Sporosarcina sp. Te-1]QTD40857.1 hypothetical protein J3U78_19270 [Sporosarcina sp. Te-1]